MGPTPSSLIQIITTAVVNLITLGVFITRAPENLKLAGNWPKVAAMCGLQDYKNKHIFVVFKLIIPITVVFMQLFWAFRPIWLAISISGSSFWLVDTYFWSYFSWLAKSGCQNLKLAGNTFPPFPSFWSPAVQRQSRDSPETVQRQSSDSPETVQRQSSDSPETV